MDSYEDNSYDARISRLEYLFELMTYTVNYNADQSKVLFDKCRDRLIALEHGQHQHTHTINLLVDKSCGQGCQCICGIGKI